MNPTLEEVFQDPTRHGERQVSCWVADDQLVTLVGRDLLLVYDTGLRMACWTHLRQNWVVVQDIANS